VVERVGRLAARLAARGVTPGSMVTIGLPNSTEFVEAMLAAWWVGATPQPISDRLPAIERRAILDLADPSLAIGVGPDDAGGRPTLSADELRAVAATPSGGRAPEPVLGPLFKATTSGGSTGRPKLIVATQPAEATGLGAFGALLAMRDNGSVLVTGPLAHNAPFSVTIVGLLLGNHIVVMPRFDATETLRLVERHRIDWLGPDVIMELYGGTELQALTIVTGREWLERPGTVGRAVVGEIEGRDEAGRPLPPGEVGELWMRRGPGEPSPYRYVGATPKSAGDGWESLGDMGKLDADGYVYLSDRLTDMILVGGANVYPGEIEAALDEHPAVRSSCVIGLPHEDLGSVPHALVELAEPVDDAELLDHLRARLAPYKLPRSIERVAEPLRDDAGKVRRSALRAARLAGS
ncbi:MAG TPA: AMP-binding protein, partial [Acidimicrobiia bacterium]|nr:AMP-binding protein [Acidimicrobiia bacterium]